MTENLSNLPLLAARGTDGLDLYEIGENKKKAPECYKLSSKICRVMKFSKSGSRLAWCDGTKVEVLETISKNIIFSKDIARTFSMCFSPDESILTTWEPYAVTKENPQGKPNLQMWNISTGECIYEIVQKKVGGWEPRWVEKSNICAKIIGSTINFFKDNNFKQTSAKLKIEKLDSFALAPNLTGPCRIACFIRGSKGAPSSVRLFKYPRFTHGDALANKSFYKADTVDLLWNKQGTSLLVKTALEVDTTGESYYGEQNLHYISIKDDSAIVTLSKKGPIYDVAWAPNSTQFCVVFGFMPAKACIFDLKCNPVFEFGPTPKNACFFNLQGNLLALAGFGNLRGNMEIWDFHKQRQVAQYQSPDTTHFTWCADGAHFVTATTAPRLRVGNGFRLWHFKDGALHQHDVDRELHEIDWQPKPEGFFKPPVISAVSQRDLKAIISASKPASYVPPHARNNPAYAAAKSRLEADDDKPAEEKPLSKSAQKRQRKREKETSKAPEQSSVTFGLPNVRNSEQQDAVAMAKYLLGADSTSQNNAPQGQKMNVQKRMKTLRKKLTSIEKLKQDKLEGKELNQEQITKINSEDAVRKELEQLQIQS